MAAASHAAFVVRVVADDSGCVRGVVICVRTGERVAFHGVGGAAEVLMRAIASELPGATSRVDEDPGRGGVVDEF